MENEFGGAGNYNQELNVMLQDILTSIMGRPLNREPPVADNSGGGQGPSNNASSFQEGGEPGQRRFADTTSSAQRQEERIPGAMPIGNAGAGAGGSEQQQDGGNSNRRSFPGLRTWTSNLGGAQVSVSVGQLPASGLGLVPSSPPRQARAGNADENTQQQQQQQGGDHPQRPMFIDPEANGPLNLGNLLASLVGGAFGRAQREDSAGGSMPMFGFPMGNLGDYVWGQNSLDDIITQMMEQNQGVRAPPPASDEAIKSLPKRRVTKEEKAAKDECGICMDEYEEGEEAVELPCKHIYHEECVDHWLKVNGTCPICRARVDGIADKSAAGAAPLREPPAPHSDLPGSFPSSPAGASTPQQTSSGGRGDEAGAAMTQAPQPEPEPMD
ncbi:hypothetical protein GQ54DRAFT_296483 [Martensiomyces pterosporus]|nr:hypothetical protein GQ54DRAFT_296483 [Martensiomyces pterosporus]